MSSYEPISSSSSNKKCRCNLEIISIIFNIFCTLGLLFTLIFIFGKESWCNNDNFCGEFVGSLGILYIILLLIGFCISPCILDLFISYTCTYTEPFDNKYHDIQHHTYYDNNKIPIIYRNEYNISACGIEKCHPFDSKKYGRIYEYLINNNIYQPNMFVKPPMVSRNDLLTVHTKLYLGCLTSSFMIMKVVELPGLCCLPQPFLYWRALIPFLYQTGGSILGIEFAFYYGWSINLGGGFHHAHSKMGGGFCVYADITLCIKYIRIGLKNKSKRNCKILIIDLDAHQGNGHERDVKNLFNNDDNIRILDAYNAQIYPGDYYAKTRIDYSIILGYGCNDDYYLNQLRLKLGSNHINNNNNDRGSILNEFMPEFIIYNAGTDILNGDPLGCMSVTGNGIIMRDEIVFKFARNNNIPILMVLSGGYQMNNANIIGNSINNLKNKGLLHCNSHDNSTD